MHAQILTAAHRPLVARDIAPPRPGPGEVLIAVQAPARSAAPTSTSSTASSPIPKLPLIPGHEIVGIVVETGARRRSLPDRRPGRRAVARLDLRRLRLLPKRPREPLRPRPLHRLPDRWRLCRADRRRPALLLRDSTPSYGDVEAAPLLCAGLIGHRTFRMAGEGERIGIYGFGAAAHIVAQVARYQGRRVFAFTAPGRHGGAGFRARPRRGLGRRLGRGAARAARRRADLRPVGALVPAALAATRQGRHRGLRRHPHERHPGLPLSLLWEERVVRSVANLTRRDAEEFLALAPKAGITTTTQALSARRGQPGARRSAFRRSRRRRGAGSLNSFFVSRSTHDDLILDT